MQVILTEEEYNEWKRRDAFTQRTIAETVERLVKDYESRLRAKLGRGFSDRGFSGSITWPEVRTVFTRAFETTPAIQTSLEAVPNTITHTLEPITTNEPTTKN